MGIFNKKNEFEELNTITFGMAADALDAVKIVDEKMQQFDDDSPVVNAALVLIPGYALGLYLIMLTDSYAKRRLGEISNASQQTFMNIVNEKFAMAILNYLIFEKHTTEEVARSNVESILGMARALYDRLATKAVSKGGDILANMMEEAPMIMVDDAVRYAQIAKDSTEADALLKIANRIAKVFQKRYEEKWLPFLN